MPSLAAACPLMLSRPVIGCAVAASIEGQRGARVCGWGVGEIGRKEL